MCVPLCVVGVLLVAQPIGLFGGSSATHVGAAGLAVGIAQACADGLDDLCAWHMQKHTVCWHKHNFQTFVCSPVGSFCS